MRDLVARDDLLLLSCAEMARADGFAIAGGVPGIELMEAAGRAVAAVVARSYPRRPVVVLCGPGNNGGDGFVAARYLRKSGWPVRVALLGDRQRLTGDAEAAATAWDGPVDLLTLHCLEGRPLVIDALFGAGLSRPVAGMAEEAIAGIADDGLPVLAIDVPSGLHGDTGRILGRAPIAEHTVTFFRGKPGHYSVEGLRHCGKLSVADIGIPASALVSLAPRLWRNAPALWQTRLRRSDREDHKFARGHLTILGGAVATGASRLAALAGRRAGAGLVTIAAPSAAMAVYQAAEPGNLVTEVNDAAAFSTILADERRNAILVGPGSAIERRTKESCLAALETGRPVVIDADAITVFADNPNDLFAAIKGPAILTPHEGEFRRLFPDLGGDAGKVERTRKAAAHSGATILLKGPDTVIAAPDGRAVVSVHAPARLATAGAGDVLAGIIGGLVAQGMAPFAAAAAAAWIHGECAYRYARPGLIAEDLVALLPTVLDTLVGVN